MKFITISNNIDFKSSLLDREFFPRGNAEASITIKNDKIIIELNESIDNCQETFLVAYDKKTEQVLSISKLSIGNENQMTISCSDEFWLNILNDDNFRYARLCIAINTGNSMLTFM